MPEKIQPDKIRLITQLAGKMCWVVGSPRLTDKAFRPVSVYMNIPVNAIFLVQTRFCGEWNLEFRHYRFRSYSTDFEWMI